MGAYLVSLVFDSRVYFLAVIVILVGSGVINPDSKGVASMVRHVASINKGLAGIKETCG